jgi:hypothetical protein
MKRVKVIRQTIEWYDVPDEVASAMEELQKYVVEKNAQITSLMGISIAMISDIPKDVVVATEVKKIKRTRKKKEKC